MELNNLYLYALSLGVLSGFHCVGMCGPIAFSIGIGGAHKWKFYIQNFLYQLGRITTYTFLGALLGIVGESLDIAGYQKDLSIIAGIFMILMVILPGKTTDIGRKFNFLNHFMVKVKSSLGNLLQKTNYSSRYLTGILNGFLPCGAVYVALAASIASAGIVRGAIFMGFFGLGTFPFMFITVLAGNFIGVHLRTKILKIFPYFIFVLGVLFILRGMGLGIHLISPTDKALRLEQTHKKNSCCE